MNTRAILTAILLANRSWQSFDMTHMTMKNGVVINSGGRQAVERCLAIADEIIDQTREQC